MVLGERKQLLLLRPGGMHQHEGRGRIGLHDRRHVAHVIEDVPELWVVVAVQIAKMDLHGQTGVGRQVDATLEDEVFDQPPFGKVGLADRKRSNSRRGGVSGGRTASER